MRKIQLEKSTVQQAVYGARSFKSASEVLGISRGTLVRLVNDMGIDTSTFSYKTEKENVVLNEKILELFDQGMVSKDIADSLGLYSSRVSTILSKAGRYVERRTYLLENENALDDLNNPATGYILGLIASDGNISKSAPEVTLTLQARDEHVLSLFMNYFGNPAPLTNISGGKYKKAWVRSQRVQDTLGMLGIHPAKTYTIEFPDIPEHLYPHFIRGIIDGDGCVYAKVRRRRGREEMQMSLTIVGTVPMISSIRDIFVQACGVGVVTIQRPKALHTDAHGSVSWQGRSGLSSIYNYIYKGAGEFYLPRKREKFLYGLRDYQHLLID